ncbi:partial UDP-2,3-diacylglucosamine pyrophosphatase LpxG, partial [Methylococcales bacterium]
MAIKNLIVKFSVLGFILCFIILAAWAFWLEPSHFIITKADIKLPKWNKQCDGLTVALLSDLHVGSPHNDLENLIRVVNATNELKPDLILLAGDYVIHEVMGGHFVKPEPIAQELEKLTAPLGVYAVLGNHDWWYSESKIKAAFAKHHIPLVDNQSSLI